ncbi:MAG: aspartate 1-decarboxylase [Candidatus Margulisbacteria bacterium]|nr:aspartate 1-decarboxylase [Candidatus Margulisiibacteriota bacterium]
MLITVLKSKIHLAKITDTLLYYQGSIGIDKGLMKASGLVAGEKVAVLNFNNSSRFETYVIEGDKGEISLRGPAAKLGKKGDKVIVLAYGQIDQSEAKGFKPKIILVDERNEIK